MQRRWIRLRRWLTACAPLIFLCTAFALPVTAQGTLGVAPDPISTTELVGFARRLELDDAHREQFFALHETYLDQFKVLRETTIDRLLEAEALAKPAWIPSRVPDPEAMKDYLRLHERSMAGIVSLENAMFDGLLPLLGESQQAALARLRLERERDRLRQQRFAYEWIAGVGVTEYRRAAEEAELTEEEIALIDPEMVAAELILTALLREVYEASIELRTEFIEESARRGLFHDPTLGETSFDENSWPVLQEVWQQVRQKSRDKAKEHALKQAAAERRMALLLPPLVANRFRMACYETRKPSSRQDGNSTASFMNRHPFVMQFEAAAKGQLSDDERQLLQAAFDASMREWGDWWDQWMADEAEYRGGLGHMALSDEDMRRTNDQSRWVVSAARQQAINDSWHARLAGVIGQLGADEVKAEYEAERARRAAARATGNTDDILGAQANPNHLAFIPPQITRSDINCYARLLGFSENAVAIASALHEDYLDGIRSIRSNEFATLTGVIAEQTYDTATRTWHSPTENQVAAHLVAREAVLDSIEQLDKALLSDIALLASEGQDHALALVQLHRTCQTRVRHRLPYGREILLYSAWQANLVDVVANARFEDAARAIAADRLAAQAPRLIAAYQTAWDARLEMWRAEWRSYIEQERLLAEGKSIDEIGQCEAVLALRATQERTAEARRDLVELNRQVLSTLTDDPSGEDAAALLDAYRRSAFPEVYKAPDALQRRLESAKALDGLDSALAARIDELAARVREGHARIAVKMCDVYESADHQGVAFGGPQAFEDQHRRTQTIEKLLFERSELESKAMLELASIIGEERMKALEDAPK